MVNTWNEYNIKVIEIKKYYNHIKENESNLSSDIFKILKANLFLMLYNLMESTVRNSIEEIHETINNDNIDYKNCIDSIKALWIEFNYKKFTQKSSKNITDIIKSIELDKVIIDYNLYTTRVKSNEISGNIDGQKIRKISEKYKINVNRRVNGHKLLTIKNTRNRLAHGEATFSEIGQIYNINDLNLIRKECKIYLKEYLLNVEKYINNKKYKI